MPAIHLARLKIQVAQLAEKVHQPAVFVRGLHELLNLYADRVHRPGQSGEPRPLLAAYKAPLPVQRQVAQALGVTAEQEPEIALALADALWGEPCLEMRLLAAGLLGKLPLDCLGAVLERVNRWIEARPEDQLVDALIEYGLSRLRGEAPLRYMTLAETWLASPQESTQRAGLRALLHLLSKTGHEHIPSVLRLMTNLTRVAPRPLRADILDILRRLVRISPQETAFFLRQNLTSPDNPDTAWLVRQLLPDFPENLRASLRAALTPSIPPTHSSQ